MTTIRMGRIDLGRGLVAAGAILVAGFLSPMDQAAAETLVIAAPGTPEGFDGDALRPQTQNVVTQVYEPLSVTAGPQGRVAARSSTAASSKGTWPIGGKFRKTASAGS